jgi:hypothetical protein
MRSSSVKTLITALSLVSTLILATPAAHAAPAPARDAITVRDEPRGIERVGRIVRRLLNRIGVGTNELPAPPVPLRSATE